MASNKTYIPIGNVCFTIQIKLQVKTKSSKVDRVVSLTTMRLMPKEHPKQAIKPGFDVLWLTSGSEQNIIEERAKIKEK